MDNLWIILLLVGVVTTFSRKSEKRKATPQKDSDQQDAQTAWERKIRELLGEEERTIVPQEAPSTSPKRVNPSPTHQTSPPQTPLASARKALYTPSNTMTQRVTSKNHLDSTAKSKASATKIDKIKESEIGSKSEIEAILDDFTMEKAVIYSEILKPKYEEM